MNGRIAAWQFVTSVLFRRGAQSAPPAELWPHVVQLCGEHLVTPALWRALEQAGLAEDLDPDARRYFEALYAMNVERNAALESQLDELIFALDERRITPLLLKGAAYLKLGIHRDIGARVLTDLDVLVPPDRLGDAVETATRLGYRRLPGSRDRLHHVAPLVRDGCAATLELHWNVGGGRARHVLPAEQAWSRARRHRGGSGEFAVFAPDDAVLHAFAHTQVADRHDRLCFIGLRTIQDLAALSAHYGAELNWQNVQQAVRRSGHERELVRYLYCAWRVGGIPPPLELAFSRSDAAYLAACRASIRWSWLRRAISGAEARWYRRWHASNAAPLLAAVRPLPKGR